MSPEATKMMSSIKYMRLQEFLNIEMVNVGSGVAAFNFIPKIRPASSLAKCRKVKLRSIKEKERNSSAVTACMRPSCLSASSIRAKKVQSVRNVQTSKAT